MLKLLISKNVNGTINANTRAYGGYLKCDKNLANDRFDKGIIKCDEGFVYDRMKRCIMVPNIIGNFSEMVDLCKSFHNSGGIEFNFGYDATDVDVQSFIDLLISGKAKLCVFKI